MTGWTPFLKKAQIEHLVRSAAAITGQKTFVMVGTGAVIAQLKNLPLAMTRTREIDIHADGAPDLDAVSLLIDGTIGEGSQFDETFGYYAHGIKEGSACLPDDWRTRAKRIPLPGQPDIACICPDVDDVALSKACAWREKDRLWLQAALGAGVLDLDTMRARIGRITNPNASASPELARRVDAIGALPLA